MRRIGVLTSGGDAPGMNAAIRAVVRSGVARGWEVVGVQHGYTGLVSGDFRPLRVRDVGGILELGGTILGSARCPEFRTPAGQQTALDHLRRREVDGLVVIGGNGSQTGAQALSALDYPVVGVASTIDNDLVGSDLTIGVDTALNVALESIDRLRVTATSHTRAFLVEVMGRDCGYLALAVGIAGGAEAIVIPEVETDPEDLAAELRAAYERGKRHAVVVVAEGAELNAEGLLAYFREHAARLGFEVRATQLGHVQRGGGPTAADRLLASRLGAAATDCLAADEVGVLVGMQRGEITTTPLANVVGRTKPLDPKLIELAYILSR